jgi:uncharacterized protein YndB with AHSA1/START domain
MSDDAAAEDRVLRLERLIAAPPERLFELWTEPEQLVKWWGPDGYEVPAHALDVRPGGHWRTTVRSSDGAIKTVSGVYRVVDAPRRIVFTWAWHQEDGSRGHETEITVTFEPAPGGTRLKLVQRAFESKEVRDNHGRGWSSSLDRLARAAAVKAAS